MFDWVVKTLLKASIKVSVSSIFLALAAIRLNTFYHFTLKIFISSNIQKWSSSFVEQDFFEVQNSRVTNSSYETELRKMTSHFELLARKCL